MITSVTDKPHPSRIAWSLNEVAGALGISVGFVRNEIGRGVLKKTKLGRRVVVLDQDLREYLARGRAE